MLYGSKCNMLFPTLGFFGGFCLFVWHSFGFFFPRPAKTALCVCCANDCCMWLMVFTGD